MLKRLRNKILVLNMLLTTVVVAVAFAVIYLIMDNQLQTENKRKLDAITEENISFAAHETATDGSEDAAAADIVQQRLPADYALSFHIKLDPYGKIQKIDSLIDLPEASYHLAAATAWKHKDGHGPITINGRLWQYAVVPATSTQVVNENGMQTIIAAQDGSYQVAFLDVTGSMETLRTLALTFVIVILAVLIAIFLISLMFANRAIRPVSEAWERQRQFIADASHELKTPLSIINANYDVLVSNKNETIISQMKWLEYMKAGTDRMTELIHSLLSLARLESETVEINKAPFNISSKISKIIESMETALHEKRITLSVSIEPGIMMNSDRDRVAQVFTILYDNAIKYTEINGQIAVVLTQTDRHITCTVSNSGAGIAPQHLTRIFDRFYRIDQARTGGAGGYGLGLSIAKACIDQLGGELTASSAVNEMTAFSFKLSK